MAKSPEEMAASMIANLKEKTGKTLPQWLKITKAAKLEKHGQIVKMLKSDHGVTHGFANLIAHETLNQGKPASGSTDLVGRSIRRTQVGSTAHLRCLDGRHYKIRQRRRTGTQESLR